MLVLQRLEDERIVICPPGQPPIVVTVVSVRGGKYVRLGFNADRTVTIHRMEIYEDMQRRKQSAGTADERARTPEGPPIDIRRHAERGGLCGPVSEANSHE